MVWFRTGKDRHDISDHPAHGFHGTLGSAGQMGQESSIAEVPQWITHRNWLLLVHVQDGLGLGERANQCRKSAVLITHPRLVLSSNPEGPRRSKRAPVRQTRFSGRPSTWTVTMSDQAKRSSRDREESLREMRCILEVMKSNFSTENLQDFSQPLADPTKSQDADAMFSQLRPPVSSFRQDSQTSWLESFGISPRGRTASSNRPMAYSTTDSVLAFGVFTTVMPRSAQASRSM